VLLRNLLLAGDRAARSLLGAGVGVRTLPTHRETAAMTRAAIRSDVHEPLDVHRDFGPKSALDLVVALDGLTKLVRVGIAQIAYALSSTHSSLLEDRLSGLATDAEDLGKPDFELLVARKIHARNTSHWLTLTLLMLGIAAADDPDNALTLDHLAMLAYRLDAATYFHDRSEFWVSL
jgi:hypothetical protein